jgi:putative nucleotidyltransferase with HDIG domain
MSHSEPLDKPLPRQPSRRSPQPADRSGGNGHGRRLIAAFEALERFPALIEPRDRLLRLVRDDRPPVADLVAAVESDPALSVAVLRFANGAPGARREEVASVPHAVRALGPEGVESVVARSQVFDFFERTSVWGHEPERFRLHAVATQRAAQRVADELGLNENDELLAGALLHDVGRLVLMVAYSGYPAEVHGDAVTPEARLRREREALGVDHAVVGGVLVRRWELPKRLATIVERHHADDAGGLPAIVRLADMLAHHSHDQSVDPATLVGAAAAVGIGPDALRRIMYELPMGPGVRRATEPSPLSRRETEILGRLAEGKVYKAIAADLGLSTNTVRSHLHNSYGKLGAVDRAQAVLIATEQGWL